MPWGLGMTNARSKVGSRRGGERERQRADPVPHLSWGCAVIAAVAVVVMSISNRVAILAQSITFVYLLSFGQCELRVGVLVLIATKSCIFKCVYILYAYVSAGLSTYFYGLSALWHVFLRVERGQAHNSLGTAFIRSAAGVVIVVFSLSYSLLLLCPFTWGKSVVSCCCCCWLAFIKCT